MKGKAPPPMWAPTPPPPTPIYTHTPQQSKDTPPHREKATTQKDLCGIKRIEFLSSLLVEPCHHSTPTREAFGTLRQENHPPPPPPPPLDMLQWETCSDCSPGRYSYIHASCKISKLTYLSFVFIHSEFLLSNVCKLQLFHEQKVHLAVSTKG